MSESLRQCVAHASDLATEVQGRRQVGRPQGYISMHSAALHDAAPIAEVMPAAMLFIPSINGISHNFNEHTEEFDIATGARAFVGAAAAVLLQHCDTHRAAGAHAEKTEL